MKSTDKQIRPAIIAPGGLRADAALYFVADEFLFHGVTGEAEQIKFLSSASLREAFAKEPMDSGWLPPGVNRYGVGSKGAWMVRWHTPAVYKIQIDGRKQPLRVPMPSLVWFGIKNNYYIFAAREKAFTPNAALYSAPVANVSKHGLICFGQNAHPDVAKGGFDVAWRMFWEAPFNTDHDNGKSKKFPDRINDQLIALHRQKASQYPAGDLVSMNINLGAAIERLTRRKGDYDYD